MGIYTHHMPAKSPANITALHVRMNSCARTIASRFIFGRFSGIFSAAYIRERCRHAWVLLSIFALGVGVNKCSLLRLLLLLLLGELLDF